MAAVGFERDDQSGPLIGIHCDADGMRIIPHSVMDEYDTMTGEILPQVLRQYVVHTVPESAEATPQGSAMVMPPPPPPPARPADVADVADAVDVVDLPFASGFSTTAEEVATIPMLFGAGIAFPQDLIDGGGNVEPWVGFKRSAVQVSLMVQAYLSHRGLLQKYMPHMEQNHMV